jgi:DinB superfamily
MPSLSFPGFAAGPDVPKDQAGRARRKVQSLSRARKAAAFSAGAARLKRRLSGFPRPMWVFRPSKEKWCIGQVLWHLADQEANLYLRLRLAAFQPGSPVPAYDQEKWTAEIPVRRTRFTDARDLVLLLRKANADLVRRLPAQAWKNKVCHPAWGTLTLDSMVGMNIWHLEHHLGQMAKRHQEWKAR